MKLILLTISMLISSLGLKAQCDHKWYVGKKYELTAMYDMVGNAGERPLKHSFVVFNESSVELAVYLDVDNYLNQLSHNYKSHYNAIQVTSSCLYSKYVSYDFRHHSFSYTVGDDWMEMSQRKDAESYYKDHTWYKIGKEIKD